MSVRVFSKLGGTGRGLDDEENQIEKWWVIERSCFESIGSNSGNCAVPEIPFHLLILFKEVVRVLFFFIHTVSQLPAGKKMV